MKFKALIGLIGLIAMALCAAACVSMKPEDRATISNTQYFTGRVVTRQQVELTRGWTVPGTGTSVAQTGAMTANALTAGALSATTARIGGGTTISKIMAGSFDTASSVTARTVSGLLPGDKVLCGASSAGGGVYLLSAVATTNTLTVTLNDDPATTITMTYQASR